MRRRALFDDAETLHSPLSWMVKSNSLRRRGRRENGKIRRRAESRICYQFRREFSDGMNRKLDGSARDDRQPKDKTVSATLECTGARRRMAHEIGRVAAVSDCHDLGPDLRPRIWWPTGSCDPFCDWQSKCPWCASSCSIEAWTASGRVGTRQASLAVEMGCG